MHVTEIDIHDDDVVRAYWEAGKEGDTFGRPWSVYWSLHSATVAMRDATNPNAIRPLAAVEDGQVVGVSQVVLPQLDNRHMAYLEVAVRPAQRRRGVGAALLEASMQLAREADRTTVLAEVHMPHVSPPESGGSHFLKKYGFAIASLEIHRVLELPIPEDHLDGLAAEAAPHHRDYRIVAWADRVPDEYVEGFCHLQAAFNTEAPLGDVALEPEAWDEKRVREGEERASLHRRHTRVTVAVSPDGTVAGLTEMLVNENQPDVGFQSATLVLPDHRGHRLGLALKVVNARAYQADFPGVRFVHSWNAEENGPMVAINDRLGFQPVEYLGEMQRRL